MLKPKRNKFDLDKQKKSKKVKRENRNLDTKREINSLLLVQPYNTKLNKYSTYN